MISRKLAAVAALTLAIGCTGTTGSSTGGSGGTSGSSGSCTLATINAGTCVCDMADSSQCPPAPAGAQWSYFCDVDVTKTCVFQCGVAADCTITSAPSNIVTQCSAGLGCDCDVDPDTQLPVCVSKVCGSDADCGSGNVCVGGACGAAPPTSMVSTCQVFPEYQVMEVGQTYTFTAQAYANGQPLHLGATTPFTWSAADSSVTPGSTAGQFTGAAATSGTAATASVKATIGSASCTGQVFVVAPPAANSVNVTVYDQLAGFPINGATVIVDSAAAQQTNASGQATFSPLMMGAPHTVSVFYAGYGYVTVAGTTSTDVLVPLLRDALDIEGGVQGTMSNLFVATSNVHVGIVGMSIADGITNISFDLLLGPSVPTMLSIGSTNVNVGLPSGVLIGLSSNQFKSSYAALGRSGYCDDPSSAGSKTVAGTCGTRSIWGLAGDVPIDKLPINQLSGGVSNLGSLNLGPILAQLLPVFSTFNSTLVRDQAITLGPVLPDGGDVNPQYLTTTNLNNGTASGTGAAAGPAVPLTLKETVKLPILPKLDGQYVSGAILLAGVNVPGRGLVPLGLAAGVDQDPVTSATTNGHVVDSQQSSNGTLVEDQLTLNMAPSHGGAEGNPYKFGILAASFTDLTNGLSASAIIATPAPCSGGTTTGLCYGGTVDVSNQTFPPFPEQASFDYVGRRFTPPTAAFSGSQTFYRASFGDSAGNRWVVFTNGAFTLPAAPAGFQDRTRSNDTTGARSDYTLAAFYVPGTFDQAASVGANNLGHADDLMTQFAIKDYSPPSLKITAPTGTSVSAGSAVTVSISGDGDQATSAADNAWTVCVSSSQSPITSTTSCKAGSAAADTSGNFDGTLPSTSVEGAPVSGGYSGFLHAVLVDGTGIPLAPPIEAVQALTAN